MNRDIIKGHWKEIKGSLKEKWADLSDNEMDRISGSWEELEGILQQKYGQTRDAARDEVRKFEDRIKTKIKN